MRFGRGFVSTVALVVVACAGSTRSGKATSGATTTATAETGPTTGAPAAAPATGPKELQGRVERIDRANHLTLAGSESVGHAFEPLKIDSGTEIRINGEKATLSELNEGDEVRASLSSGGDQLHVERLEVLSSGR